MDKREFTRMRKRIVIAFLGNKPEYDRAMDEAALMCSEDQWRDLNAAIKAANEKWEWETAQNRKARP